MIEQSELNDLVCDLKLSNHRTELLGSRLQQWNLFAPETKLTLCTKRGEKFSIIRSTRIKVCLCLFV